MTKMTKMAKMSKMVGLCLSVFLLLALAGCPTDSGGNSTVAVTGVTIWLDGHDITGLQKDLWEPAETDVSHPTSVQLNAVVIPSNAAKKTVVWSTSVPGVATVSDTGMVYAAAPGDAVITATADGKTATVDIKVWESGRYVVSVQMVNILIDGTEVTGTRDLYIGTPMTLAAEVKPDDAEVKDVLWASSSTDVATIDAEGVVTALKPGITTITVTTKSLTVQNSPATASLKLHIWNNPGWTPPPGYLNTALDMADPVFFYGDHLYYKNQRIELGDYAVYIDGRFSNAEIDQFHTNGYTKVFNDFNKLFETRGPSRGQNPEWADHVKRDGTATNPFYVYLAPWVHWVDDPDDPATYQSDILGNFINMGSIDYLRLIGLTEDFRKVVIASNRAQGNGAQGNTSMFSLNGAWHRYENLSMGIYAPFDIEFPLDDFLPDNLLERTIADDIWGVNRSTGKLSRFKRSPNSGQGGINGGGNSGDFVAVNCGFYSRHNSAIPSSGNTMYYKCQIEVGMHGGSWGSNRIYLESSIGLWNAQNGGATGSFAALGTDIYLRGNLADSYGFGDGWNGIGGGALIDVRVISDSPSKGLFWSLSPPNVARVYQSNVTYLIDHTYNPSSAGGGFRTLLTESTARGEPYTLHQNRPDIAVDLTGKAALKAYKFEYGGKTWYNTYELFRGSNADYEPAFPAGVKEAAIAAGATGIPRGMTVALVTGGTGADAQSNPNNNDRVTYGEVDDRKTLEYAASGTGLTAAEAKTALGTVTWRIIPGAVFANIITTQNPGEEDAGAPAIAEGNFRVLPNNTQYRVPQRVTIQAVSAIGLVGTYSVQSWPMPEGVQTFVTDPVIQAPANGKLTVTYDIGLVEGSGLDDWSIINWYRSDNADGTGNRTLVWTTRPNTATPSTLGWLGYRPPEYTYPIHYTDIGKFITVEVTPGHSNSTAGTSADMKSFTYPAAIAASDFALKIDYPTFDGFPNIDAYADGNNAANVGGAKPLVTTRGIWLADTTRPDEMPYSGRGYSGATQTTPWSWTVPATTNSETWRPTIAQRGVGSRLFYTPPARSGNYGNMDITWKVGHPKSGQVGGSALQWTEFMFNFDWENGTGYALRVERTNLPNNSTSQIGIVKYRGWSKQENFTANGHPTAPLDALNPYTDPVFPIPARLKDDTFTASGGPGNTLLPIGVVHDLTDSAVWDITPKAWYDTPPTGWHTMTQTELRRNFIHPDEEVITDGKTNSGAYRYRQAWWMSRPSIYFRTNMLINIKVAEGKIKVDMRNLYNENRKDLNSSFDEATHTLYFEYTVPAEDLTLINNHQGGIGVWTPMTSGAGNASNDNSLYLYSLNVDWGN